VNHPDKSTLALLAGGDLGFWSAAPLRLHLRGCERCQAELKAYDQTRQLLSEAAKELPQGLEWNQLAEEMTGNIRVGLAAGECVGGYPARSRFLSLRWNGALAAAVLTGIFVVGFWLNIPEAQMDHLMTSLGRITGHSTPPPRDVLLASRQGIEVKGNDTSLSYVPPDPDAAVVSVSTRGSAAVRQMDEDTGQTTITEVYDAR